MGCDAYHPVSRVGSNLTDAGSIGYMVLDAMDSLILLGLDEEYQRAREWVANELSFDRDAVYSTFEVRLPEKHQSLVDIMVAHDLSR
jgi:mannosyl-oligosaccharide alpha-1,2-mannosidase